MSERLDRVRGDSYGLELPAHPQTLREAGPAFLTRAFHASGVLAADNEVREILACEDCPGGSTGRKLRLSLRYARAAPGLHTQLFAKFSRDFDDAIRDRGRAQMALECRFARLSRDPAFPIAVPACLYADYHEATGTGLLITQCIAFGRGGIEPHQGKCLDHAMPDPPAHYAAILDSLAKLAGVHRGGRLPPALVAQFPFESEALSVGAAPPMDAEQVRARVGRYAEFAARFPRLLPDRLRAPGFIARLSEEAPHLARNGNAIRNALENDADAIALSHWNANVDNAWFWRESDGQLGCGLFDWGCASQMHLAMSIWGSLSGADTDLWNATFDALLARFVRQYEASGGPRLDTGRLRAQVIVQAVLMGTTWLLDAPRYLQRLVPDLEALRSRHDPRLLAHEMARCQLQMLTTFLNLWEANDLAGALDTVIASRPVARPSAVLQ